MTKDDKVFVTIFLVSMLHQKKLLNLGKSYLICEESADVSKFTKCMSRQIVDCIMEILTLISMSMQKKNPALFRPKVLKRTLSLEAC